MSENGRSRRNGGFDEDSAQIHEHQKKQDEEAQLEKIWKELENSEEGMEIDPEKFLRDMAILDDLIPLPDFDLSASWQEFKEKHHELLADLDSANQQSSAFASEEKPKRRRPMKSIRVALVVVMILAMLLMASCGIIEYIIKAIANWSDQVFQYEVTQELRVEEPTPELPDALQFDSLEAALDAYGVTTGYVGILYPDGFTFEKIEVREYSDAVKFSVTYANDGKEITFTIWHYKDSTALELQAAEKLPQDAEIYTCHDNEFYIMDNTENTTVTWIGGTEKYSLVGDYSAEEGRQMIDSIYERFNSDES